MRFTLKLALAALPGAMAVVATAGLLLSGCFSFRSVSGKIYGPGVGAVEGAVRDSASVNLQCPSSEVRNPRIVTSAGRHQNHLYVADGCGQRAVYAMDCSSPRTQLCGRGAGAWFERDSCRPTGPSDCELVLISKVPLD